MLRKLALIVTMLVVACSAGPRPIAYGRADCTYCRMRIDDSRFGGEIVSTHGKVLQFDAVECMAAYYRALQDRNTAASVWVTDFQHPGTLIPVASARFVRLGTSPRRGSPMGAGLLAVSTSSDVDALRTQLGDVTTLGWSDVIADTNRVTGVEGKASDAF